MQKGNLTTAKLAWAAGLIEGEGCITLNGRYRRTPMLSLGMTDKDIVERFKDIFGLNNKIYCFARKGPRKPYYELKVVGKNAVGLMFTLFSFLGARRRERIKEVVNIWRSTKGKKQGEVSYV